MTRRSRPTATEVLNLRWDQVDFDAGTITLVKTKSGKPQLVVMNAPARQVLQRLHKIKASEWVLPARDDPARPLSKTAMETAWQRIRTAAKIEDVRLHDLRHTFGSYAGHAGANSFLVRELSAPAELGATVCLEDRAVIGCARRRHLSLLPFLTAKYDMTTFDEVLVKASSDFMDRAKRDGKPFFVWHNTTRMHVWTLLSKKYSSMQNSQTNYGLEEAGMAQMDDSVGALLKPRRRNRAAAKSLFLCSAEAG